MFCFDGGFFRAGDFVRTCGFVLPCGLARVGEAFGWRAVAAAFPFPPFCDDAGFMFLDVVACEACCRRGEFAVFLLPFRGDCLCGTGSLGSVDAERYDSSDPLKTHKS